MRRCSACSRPSMRAGLEGIRYASIKLVDGATFLALPEVEDGVENPLPGLPEAQEFYDRLPGWYAEPPDVVPGTPDQILRGSAPTPSRQAEFQSQQATVHPRILGWTAFTAGVTMAAMRTRILLLALLICAALPMAAEARPTVVVDAAITGRLVTYERTRLTVVQSGVEAGRTVVDPRGATDPPGRRGRRPGVREPLPGHAQRASTLGQLAPAHDGQRHAAVSIRDPEPVAARAHDTPFRQRVETARDRPAAHDREHGARGSGLRARPGPVRRPAPGHRRPGRSCSRRRP